MPAFHALFFATLKAFNRNAERTKSDDAEWTIVCDYLSTWVRSDRSFWECSVSRIINASIRKKTSISIHRYRFNFYNWDPDWENIPKDTSQKGNKNYINRFFFAIFVKFRLSESWRRDLKKLATYFLSKIWKQSLGNFKEEIKHAFTERIELGFQKTHLSLQFWAFSEDRVFRQLKKGYLQQETLVKIEILGWDLDRWSQNKGYVDCRNRLSKWVVISNTFLSYPKIRILIRKAKNFFQPNFSNMLDAVHSDVDRKNRYCTPNFWNSRWTQISFRSTYRSLGFSGQ